MTLSKTPESILNSSGCTVKTLTISENHATLLLTHKLEDEDEDEDKDGDATISRPPLRSLLKVMVQPVHLDALRPPENKDEGEDEEESSSSSSKIISFLNHYEFQLDSESGAEYTYFSLSPKRSSGMLSTTLQNFMRSLRGDSTSTTDTTTVDNTRSSFKAEFISPASERQIQRAMPSVATSLIHETPALYHKVTLPHIQSIVHSGSLSWIQNVVHGRKEQERLLLNTEHYILNIDTKWKSHPNPHTTPRREWHSHSSTTDLYCLVIFKDTHVTSLRDLRGTIHLPILKSIMNDCPRAIQDIYGVAPDQLRIFVHYQPQFYAFHIHLTRLENEMGCQVERGHLVSDIIQNLESDPEYYQKRTITYKLKVTDKLYQLLLAEKQNVK